jgi:hypothetical protein
LEEAMGKSSAESTAKHSSINCIVTSGSLIPSLAKCLLYRLDDVVAFENGMSKSSFEHFVSVVCLWKICNGIIGRADSS